MARNKQIAFWPTNQDLEFMRIVRIDYPGWSDSDILRELVREQATKRNEKLEEIGKKCDAIISLLVA